MEYWIISSIQTRFIDLKYLSRLELNVLKNYAN